MDGKTRYSANAIADLKNPTTDWSPTPEPPMMEEIGEDDEAE